MPVYLAWIAGSLLLTGIGVATVATVWHNILDLAAKSLFPWFEEHLPTIAPYVKEAFLQLDDVIAPIRRAVKKAWDKLRSYLLKTVVKFERKTPSLWIRRITSYIVEKLDRGKPIVKKIETEEEVNWDDLPADVKAAFVQNGKDEYELDITEAREKELKEVLELTQ